MKHKIPVTWTVNATLEIEADSLEQAIEKAGKVPLPEGEYMDGSFEIRHDLIEEGVV